jgi:hypothetical protein
VKLQNPLRPREKFLILEIAPRGTNGLFLSVDEDRNIIFEKFIKNIDLKKFLQSPARRVSQKAWEGKYLFKSRRKIIAAAHPSFATTIPIPLDIPRERASAKSKITIAELENLIAQEMQKIFNGCRSEAAKRMGMNDLDVILVGAKARHFKVDGKAVVSPAGFAGKKISLLLELTFTGRELFEDLKQFFNSPDDFFFAEAPQAHLFSLSRVRKLPLSLIVANEANDANRAGNPADALLYVLENAKDDYPVLYRETLNWSFSSLFRAIMEALAVSETTAKELYRSYRKGEMSEGAKRGFKQMLDPTTRTFFEEVGKAAVGGTIYVDAPFVLPFDLPHKQGGAKFEEHPIGEILGELGFTADAAALGGDADAGTDAEKNNMLRSLLYFLEAYFDKSNSEINQKLRRRLHWLAG